DGIRDRTVTGVQTCLFRSLLGVTIEPHRGQRRPGDVRRFTLDCRKADQLLAWRPATRFAEGLRQTVDDYRRPADLRRQDEATPRSEERRVGREGRAGAGAR